MKKTVWVLMILLVVSMGCAKKHVKAPEPQAPEEKAVMEEAIKPEEKTEVVTDISVPERGVAEQEIQPGTAQLSADAVALSTNDVLFDFDKYAIRQDARPILNAAATYLKDKKEINIVIEGHCDERGTNEYNLALGEKRAKAVKDHLAALGILQSRMSFVTYGEERPLCTEQNEDCWQRNRRGHLVVQ